MPLIAPTNWPMISGFSGLPKFRLSVVARGRAPDGAQVAIGFGHRLLAALERVRLHIARRHVRGEGQRLARPMHPHHARAKAGGDAPYRPSPGCRTAPRPRPCGHRTATPISARSAAIGADRGHRAQGRRGRGLDPGPVIFRRAEDDSFDSGRSAFTSLPCRIRKRSSGIVSPTMAKSRSHLHEDRPRLGLHLGLQHHQHPLLAFRQHHLVGGHAGFALRHVVKLQLDAKPALVAHLDRRTGQARRPHVLDGDHRARGHQLQTGLQQPLFGEGVADLHRGALFLDRVVELGARPSWPRPPRRGPSWRQDRPPACRRPRPTE